MIPGEGVGVVVLKRLRDAERDGDRIYAVLKGVGLASDGRRRGLAAPSARGHARAIRRAYRDAGIDPRSVELSKATGWESRPPTGRSCGPCARSFRPRAADRALGAVSSQIGHAMPAAGHGRADQGGPGAAPPGPAADAARRPARARCWPAPGWS